MIYLVTTNKALLHSSLYDVISVERSLDLLAPLKIVGFDIETEGLNCRTKKLYLVQLGCKEFQVVIDCTTIDIRLYKEYLESDRLFLGHNLMFDIEWMYHYDIWPRNIRDTMLAEQLLFLGYPRIISVELMNTYPQPLPYYEYIPSKDPKKQGTWELHMSLQATAKRRIGTFLDKSVRGEVILSGITEPVIAYAAHDVEYLESVYDAQLEALRVEELEKAWQFESTFLLFLAYVKYCGMNLDPVKWQAKMDKDYADMVEAEKKLNEYVVELSKKGKIFQYPTNQKERTSLLELGFHPDWDSDGNHCYSIDISNRFTTIDNQGDLFSGFNLEPQCTINWGSNPQVCTLFELLGIKVKTFDKKTKKEKKSVEEKQIAPQAHLFPIIPLYLDYTGAAKVVTTYGSNWLRAIDPVDKRVHCEIHVIGTDTSRCSSGGGPYKLNAQNLPHDAVTRGCFVSGPGRVFISADYCGQESAITASVANDERMLDILNTGGDMHSTVAKLCWPLEIGDTPVERVKKLFNDIRGEAKKVEFGIFYGGDNHTLEKNLGFDSPKALDVYTRFMDSFTGIKGYQDYCRAEVMKKGYIKMNPVFGHRAHIFDFSYLSVIQDEIADPYTMENYYFYSRHDKSHPLVKRIQYYNRRKSESERQSINYRIQNRGACAFKLASIYLFKWLRERNYLNVVKVQVVAHDEIDLDCPIEIAEEVAAKLVECMEEGGKYFCTRTKLSAEVSRLPDGSLPTYWVH